MKNLTFLLCCFFGLQSCFAFTNQNIKGSGKAATENRVVENYTEIQVSNGIYVEVSQGELSAITVETDDNLLDYIKTEVTNGVLKIYSSSRTGLNSKSGINVRMTVPSLNAISVNSGSYVKALKAWTVGDLSLNVSSGASIKSESAWSVNNMWTSASSGANLHFEVNAQKCEFETSSGASVHINGTCETLSAKASSGSSLKLKELSFKKLERLDVSSGASVGLKEKLPYNVTSGGNVY